MSEAPDYTRRAADLLEQVSNVTPIPDSPDIAEVHKAYAGRMMHMAQIIASLVDSDEPRDMLVILCIIHNMEFEARIVQELTALSVPDHVIYEANEQAMNYLNINLPNPKHN